MADDVTIGSGATTPLDVTVAADEVAGKKYQRVKISSGDDGTVVDVGPSNPLPVSGTVTANIGTVATLATEATQTAQTTLYGGVTETAPGTDTASSGLNGRLQRIAQRLTSIIGLLPTALGANGGLKVEGVASGTPVPVSGSISVTGTMPVDSSKVEDAAHASGDTGAFVLAVRNDAGTALAGTTGDYIPLSTDASGNLRVAGGGGGTQFAEDAVHTSGDLGTMALGVRKDTATALAGTDGDYTPLITDASGRQHVNVGTSVLPTGAATETSVALSATALGAPADAAATTTGSVIAQLRRVANLLAGTLTVSGTVTTTPPSNASTNLAQVAGATTATGHGTASGALRVELPTDGTGVVGLVAGAAAIGSVTTELATGLSTFSNTALSNTKTAVKASAGKVYGWMVHNPSAATAYIQVWNVAIGSITVGTTAPTWTIPLPAGASANVMSERGVTHSTEINIAATTTATGSTAPATAAVVSLFYI